MNNSLKSLDTRIEKVIDFYGCKWVWDPDKDLYFNQVSRPLEKYETLSESLDKLPGTDWDDFLKILERDLSQQTVSADGFCCVADRHVAGLTENSMRVRGHE